MVNDRRHLTPQANQRLAACAAGLASNGRASVRVKIGLFIIHHSAYSSSAFIIQD
jgi:transketolase C-terminal domain/subunit